MMITNFAQTGSKINAIGDLISPSDNRTWFTTPSVAKMFLNRIA